MSLIWGCGAGGEARWIIKNKDMRFNTNKDIGNSGLAMSIAYFGANGYTVSLPLNDTQDYDLIADDGMSLYKVQVKATKFKSKSGKFIVSLKSSGGTSGKIYKRVADTNVDIVFVVCEDGALYLIPAGDIKHIRSSITLGDGNIGDTINYQNYRVFI